LEQPHVERERCCAAAAGRQPRVGTAAYQQMPLTGAFQSTFPVYRQRTSFGLLGDASQLTARPVEASAPCRPLRLSELFGVDEQGKITAVLKGDGTAASGEELEADAQQWASHFAQDVFNNHCTNHEHDCTETCIKYAKKKLEARQSLRSHKVPSCRFWYFRVKCIHGKKRRRRGKPLVSQPYIEETDDRNQQFRCQCRREQPFRSTSNDVCQVTDRCNVDFQFLFCAPSLPPAESPQSNGSASQPAAAVPGKDEASRPPKRRRLTQKTPACHQRPVHKRAADDSPSWFPSATSLSSSERACIRSFAASFQKAHAIGYYITKYCCKPLEVLTPLFMTMTSGIHRLEKQEQEEEEEAVAARQCITDHDGASQPVRKQRKTIEELQRRARRVTIRLACMANRCFWLSAAEVVVHILTDGDCLQSHNNMRIFTRQLQWAAQQCKRQLNHETAEEVVDHGHQKVHAVSCHVKKPGEDDERGHDVDQTDDSDVSIDKVEACTTTTNTADDYAHRGRKLWSMPYYVYRMYVHRVPRSSSGGATAPNIFRFENHYVLAKTYVQEVVLNAHVPTIDGFQCPTVQQDVEQNALLKSLLFTPWACTDPMQCGNVMNFRHFLSSRCGDASVSADVSQLAKPLFCYTFNRAWRLRRGEVHVLAARADARSRASRKWLVLADTTLLAEQKEPLKGIQVGEETKCLLRQFCSCKLHRTMPAQSMRLILAFLDLPSKWHDEQCTLAEFCAYVARDVIAHVDLAAEARVNKPKRILDDAASEHNDSDSDDANARDRNSMEFVDMGGGPDDAESFPYEDDVSPFECSSHPLRDISKTISLCFQQDDLTVMSTKSRKSLADLQLKDINDTYEGLLKGSFACESASVISGIGGFGQRHHDMVALQKQNIALARKQMSGGAADLFDDGDDDGDAFLPISSAAQPAEPAIVPLPLASRGPAAVAWQLCMDAKCTEEQIDAVALLALSLQKRFDARTDKSTIRLPVATAENNHRAVWLGGGGVGKTRTLQEVVQPLAETYFGPNGYAAAAQSNHAAQNLGNRSRTLHAANGLLMTDSLQTARLRLNPQTQKKMDRLVGDLGVDVIDEVGCVPGDLLHADALRKTYGRRLRHNIDAAIYMKPSETWGRMPVKLLSGDFYQLPPVPATASLLAPPVKQSYEHQQGRKLLMDMEYVIDFVKMQRFDDPLLVEVLEAMRTRGGKKISDEAWKALKATEIQRGASEPAQAAEINGVDPRLADARNWYECAYEWRIVSYAMHAHARLNARAAGKLLFYIPAIDAPTARMNQEDFDEMRGLPNIGATAKLPGILPIFVGMEMILTESYLPPRIVRGAPVTVVDIELHPDEPPLSGRQTIATHGCVLLLYMPKCIYVRVQGCTDVFLGTAGSGVVEAGASDLLGPSTDASQPGVRDLKGILAVLPTSRPWRFQRKDMTSAVSVSRTQCPLLPRKQCTLHGIQGTTADPGFIAHWKFPKGLKKESIWLAYYVSLSRPRGFSRLLSHGLPDRSIIEGGPPQSIGEALDELFTEKITATKAACVQARATMGWPPRRE